MHDLLNGVKKLKGLTINIILKYINKGMKWKGVKCWVQKDTYFTHWTYYNARKRPEQLVNMCLLSISDSAKNLKINSSRSIQHTKWLLFTRFHITLILIFPTYPFHYFFDSADWCLTFPSIPTLATQG